MDPPWTGVVALLIEKYCFERRLDQRFRKLGRRQGASLLPPLIQILPGAFRLPALLLLLQVINEHRPSCGIGDSFHLHECARSEGFRI